MIKKEIEAKRQARLEETAKMRRKQAHDILFHGTDHKKHSSLGKPPLTTKAKDN